MAKAADGRYYPGKRAWVKIKNRQIRDVICAAVTGTLQQPRAFVAGLAGADGRLVIAGRSTVLTTAEAAQLAAALTLAGSEHPLPEQISNGVFGTRDTTAILRTEPVVVEVDADTALYQGRFRHALRYIRVRPELSPQDVPALPTTG